MCATLPEIPESVITAIEGDQVKISWTLPLDNGSPITQYKVFIKEIDSGVFTLESTDCVGTDATVIANEYCYVSIPTLLATPYGVDGGDSIFAKVSAVNFYGETD